MTTGGLRDTRLAGLTGRPARRLTSVVIVVAILLIWWWPGLLGEPEGVDVELVIGDGLSVADQSIDRRLREEGFRISRTLRPVDWCAVPDVLEELRPESTRLVLWAEASADCDLTEVLGRVVDQAGNRRLIAVQLPSDDPRVSRALDDHGLTIVDGGRLLGEPGQAVECVWWEDCPSSGTIQPWTDGVLNSIGGERLARMIVTAAL